MLPYYTYITVHPCRPSRSGVNKNLMAAYKNPVLSEAQAAHREAVEDDEGAREADARLMRALKAVHSPIAPNVEASASSGSKSDLIDSPPQSQPKTNNIKST